ncbi:MAG TPA: endo alpha-1,4 polygalactosaminidase [Pseudonocardiaceae bacterium]
MLPTPLVLFACCLALAGCSATAVPEPAVVGGTSTPSSPITTATPSTSPITTTPATSPITTVPTTSPVAVRPPPPHARFDYQIGQSYPPPAGVRVVTRDRAAAPVPGLYNVCYLNAYQTQTDETDWWLAHHPDLLLTGVDGHHVRDPNWDELLLDISTPGRRTALADIVNGWIDGCERSGFNAVEPDNLDSWTRSAGLLTAADALAFARLIITHAHADGLAIAQKNAADIADQGWQAGFDFAVAEQCADYDECRSYTAAYGDEVIVIEYGATGLAEACAGWGNTLSVVRRDLDVTAPGSAGYVYQTC